MGALLDRLHGVATESQDGRGGADDRDIELVRDGHGRLVNPATGVVHFTPVEPKDEGGDAE